MRLGAMAAAMLVIVAWGTVASSQDVTQGVRIRQDVTLTPPGRARLAEIRALRGVRSAEIAEVNVGALRGARVGQTVRFQLSSDLEVTARTAESARPLGGGRTLWRGHVAASGETPAGDAVIVFDGDAATGTITSPDGRVFQLRPIPGAHVVTEIDFSTLPPDGAPQEDQAPGGGTRGQAASGAQTDAGIVTIDLLVAYTNAARTAHGNIDSLIDLAVVESNLGFTNSGVNARFRVVRRQQVSYSESGRSYEQINNDEVSGAVVGLHAGRDASGADVVVLIVHQNDQCGRAASIGGGANAAFVAVHHGCATGNYSFAHEVGHLAGARHDLANDDSLTPFAYGHGFRHPPGGWRTIMGVICDAPLSCPTRRNNWSNPNLSFGGVAMGTTTRENNARVWTERAPVLAGFRSPPGASLCPACAIPAIVHTVSQIN